MYNKKKSKIGWLSSINFAILPTAAERSSVDKVDKKEKTHDIKIMDT